VFKLLLKGSFQVKKKSAQSERRIYVILAQSVDAMEKDGSRRRIKIPTGMQAAQSAHVTGIYRLAEAELKAEQADLNPFKYEAITTITLGARNSREMLMIWNQFQRFSEYRTFRFDDYNLEFYGDKRKYLTAICTEPVTEKEAYDCIGHLDLA
jgi:hypothetical protein